MRNNWFSKIRESLKIKRRYLNRVFLFMGLRGEVPHLVRGFTLIELLIVVGIVAILATVIALTLNPSELLRQARDSRRVSETQSINQAMSLALALKSNLFVGASNYVYLSLPDNDGDGLCNEYPNLPPLVSPWQYACTNPSNFRKVNGTGWIPVDFTSLPMVPLETLPVDPVNTYDKRCLYYRYVPGWELGANMESEKYKFGGSQDVESNDGGNNPALYEKGVSLVVAPETGCWTEKVDTSCVDGSYSNGFWYEAYSRWTIPGSGKVAVTKLWYYQPDNTLSNTEQVEVALYNGGVPNYNKISESVFINGTGGSGWVSGDLVTPITISLGQTYFNGIGRTGGAIYSLAVDTFHDCGTYLPMEGSYWEGTSGSLNASVPLTNPPDGNSPRYGFVGVTYQ